MCEDGGVSVCVCVIQYISFLIGGNWQNGFSFGFYINRLGRLLLHGHMGLIRWTFLAVFPGIILGILHELLLILQKLLGQFGAQWMFGLGIVD